MKEIIEYLRKNNIEAKMLLNYNGLDLFEFNLYDCKINIIADKNISLDYFKKEANKQYLEHLKNQYNMFNLLAKKYIARIENYEPTLK